MDTPHASRKTGPAPCPICGQAALLELIDPSGAALCPNCGALFEWFRHRLAQLVPSERVTLHASLAKDLGADSLDVVEIVMEMEEEQGIRISDEEMEHIDTIADILRYVHKKKQEAEAAPATTKDAPGEADER